MLEFSFCIKKSLTLYEQQPKAMKKYYILTTLIILAFVNANAQEWTVRVAGGYAGPGLLNTENILGPKIDPSSPSTDALVNLANINDSLKTYKPIHGSYGTGGNVTLGVGYMFNNYIGLDLGVSYAHSSTISCTEIRTLPGFTPATYLYANINTSSWAIAVLPSLVITGQKTGWKVYPYGRFGIILPVAGKLTDNVDISAPALASSPVNLNSEPFWLGSHTQVQLVTQATVSLGFNGALGVAYRPLPFMNVFLEVSGQYLNVRGKSSEITKWTTDGVNDLPDPNNPGTTRSVYRTKITYVDQLTATSNNAQYNTSYDKNKPKEDVRPTVPGSYLGFNVGVTFFLSKKTLKKQDKTATTTKK